MEPSAVRRVSSAAFRLPRETNCSNPVARTHPRDRTRPAKGGTPHVAPELEDKDPVKQDRLWRDVVCTERRAALEWEKNWSFLKSYNHLGQLRSEETLTSDAAVSSASIPHTSNQALGSRLSTPLAKQLLAMDGMLLWTTGRRRCRRDPEMLPC